MKLGFEHHDTLRRDLLLHDLVFFPPCMYRTENLDAQVYISPFHFSTVNEGTKRISTGAETQERLIGFANHL